MPAKRSTDPPSCPACRTDLIRMAPGEDLETYIAGPTVDEYGVKRWSPIHWNWLCPDCWILYRDDPLRPSLGDSYAG